MQIAERVYSLAQEQDDSALMIGAYSASASTLYFSGDFVSARQNAMLSLQIWRLGGGQSHVEDVDTPVLGCLCHGAISEWHFGEIATCEATMTEAIAVAKELKDMHALAHGARLFGWLAHSERNPSKVERLASEVIELSTRYNFVFWMATAAILRGWARSALGYTAEGVSWIENGIGDFRATGTIIGLPFDLALKAEALHFAGRTLEALEAIKEAEALVERSEERWWSAELHRLRGVFLAAYRC